MKNKILILAGPTASGKTEIARWISKRLACVMISFDSMQAYRSMPITTQAPSGMFPGSPKTHLVNFIDPQKEYNAAAFCKDARPLIEWAFEKKKIPFLIGGTGLYLRALLDGLFENGEGKPFKDEVLRQDLLAQEAKAGGGYLHGLLKEKDPASAAGIHPNDTRRLVRALEVCHLSGRPFSSAKKDRKGLRESVLPILFFLDRAREDLYQRINRRVGVMMRKGLVAEIKKLIKKPLSRTAAMALGVREVSGYLEGKIPLAEASELLKKNTRNYAKRQITWFRHEPGARFVSVAPEETSRAVAERILKEWFQTS